MPRDFFQQRSSLVISLQLFRQHLRIGRNNGKGRIDFMRDACGQQANRRKLVSLGELRFQFYSLSDVVHDDQPADHVEFLRDQWRYGDVHGASLAGGGIQPELVQIVNAGILPNTIELFYKRCWKDLAQRTCQRLPARKL